MPPWPTASTPSASPPPTPRAARRPPTPCLSSSSSTPSVRRSPACGSAGSTAGTLVTFADDRSGLEQGTLVDGSNYQFGKSVPAVANRRTPYFVTSLGVSHAARPTDPQTVTVSIKNGRYLPGGRYQLTIDSAGRRGHPGPQRPPRRGRQRARRRVLRVATLGQQQARWRFRRRPRRDGPDQLRAAPNRNGFATPLDPSGNPATGRRSRGVSPSKSAARAPLPGSLPAGPIQAFAKAPRAQAAGAAAELVRTPAH